MGPNILPGIEYFQIVFTVGDSLDDLVRANRTQFYGWLMKAAWQTIDELLREMGIKGGASMVLHTWNQRMLHHPHVHALLPCGGIATDSQRWVTITKEQRNLLQQKTGKRFRDIYLKGIERLHRRGELDLQRKCLESLRDPVTFAETLKSISPRGFNVFVQPPPKQSSRPEHVLKYIARYITGGPISNSRLVSHKNGKVTFLARSLESHEMGMKNGQVEVEVTGVEFVRRWSMHILPKRLYRIRHYGGMSNPCRKKYLAQCRELLGIEAEDLHKIDDPKVDDADRAEFDHRGDTFEPVDENQDENEDQLFAPVYHCPRCKKVMVSVIRSRRPSWRITLTGPACPAWYRKAFQSFRRFGLASTARGPP